MLSDGYFDLLPDLIVFCDWVRTEELDYSLVNDLLQLTFSRTITQSLYPYLYIIDGFICNEQQLLMQAATWCGACHRKLGAS